MSLIVRDSGRRWVNGVIPFKEHSSMNADPALQAAAAQARQAWEAAIPVRFVAQSTEPDTFCSSVSRERRDAPARQDGKAANRNLSATAVLPWARSFMSWAMRSGFSTNTSVRTAMPQ